MKLLASLLLVMFLNTPTHPLPPLYKLYVFEGSDWCTNCKRLDKNVLSQQDFQDFLRTQHIELVLVDFPQRKKLSKEQREINEKIAEKFAFEGVYPTLVVEKIDGLAYTRLTYQNESVGEFAQKLQTTLTQLK
jgi:thiol-disulfide isomerase/thioredoxin